MAIANRDLDSTEQNYVIMHAENTAANLVTGATIYCGAVPSPGILKEVKIAAAGISNVPVYTPQILRWTSGGVTVIAPGGGITVAGSFGASGGMVGATYAPSSSLAAVQAGDVLILLSSGSNTSSLDLVAGFVIQATQDFKKSFDI